jgi:RHS repeat-associated protein
MVMAGISSKALNGAVENKHKFNDGTEFNIVFDINLYETSYRNLDPQVGRFWQIDPCADYFDDFSTYSFAFNNPILYNDPTGLAPISGDTVFVTQGFNLEEVKVTAPKKLDTENGQVRSPVQWWEYIFGWGDWHGWEINSSGYLTGKRAPILLEIPDLGGKKGGLKKANEASKFLVYAGRKKLGKRFVLYIGKAKNSLKKRYSQTEIDELEAKVLEKLDDLPDNGTALGVEQAIMDLNGGKGVTSNIRNATNNEIYKNQGIKWLNDNIPNWKDFFKMPLEK